MKLVTKTAVLAALFAVAYGASVNSHQGTDSNHEVEHTPTEVVSSMKAKALDIVRRAARELFQTVVEEKSKTQASWGELYKNAYPEIQGRALNPLGNVPMNLAFGLGALALGMAGMSFGGSTVARSLKSAYDGIDWRQSVAAMTRDDFLERAFDWMDVKDVACKKRMVCEVEQYAADQSTFKTLILKFLSKRHPGLHAYSDAVDTGLDYFDCAEAFPECPMNSLQLLGNIPLDRLGVNPDYVTAIPWAKIAENINVMRNMV